MFRIVCIIGFIVLANAQQNGIVVLKGDPGVEGEITLTETDDGLLLHGIISGLKPGKHGFHIHQFGDLRKGCGSTGGHYNPYNRSHGAPEDQERHAGDLGNVIADNEGNANVHVIDKHISLSGEHNVLGRAIVVHAGEDDLGRGGHQDSKTTGNAGGRVACGIIGLL